MKKIILSIVLVLSITVLAGCTVDNDGTDFEDLEARIEALETSLAAAETSLEETQDDLAGVQADLTTAETTITDLETEVTDAANSIIILEAINEQLNIENMELDATLKTTNARIKNALNRDNWLSRKVKYNADFTSYDAEYCFGIFDEDWTLETASEYTHNTGLKFVITIEQIMWGTEIFAKDSCGNYSEFIYADSAYALYSTPLNFFEEGHTYEVVLYKEVYFTVNQLGLLPLVDMADFGAYPADLSGIVSTEVE